MGIVKGPVGYRLWIQALDTGFAVFAPVDRGARRNNIYMEELSCGRE